MAKRVRHIPDTDRTYCGKPAASVPCIDKKTTPIDEAECKSCQRSDERRTREAYERSLRDQVRALAVRAAKRFATQYPGKVIFPSVPERIESAWLLVPEALREERFAWREYRNAFSDELMKAFREARQAIGLGVAPSSFGGDPPLGCSPLELTQWRGDLLPPGPGLVSARRAGPSKEGESK